MESSGSIRIESKDNIRARLGRSTDRADAVVMAFWPADGAMEIGPSVSFGGQRTLAGSLRELDW